MEKPSDTTGRDGGGIEDQEMTDQVMEVESNPAGMEVEMKSASPVVVVAAVVEAKVEETSPVATILQESNRSPEPPAPPAVTFPAPKPKVQVPPRVSIFSRDRYMSPTDSLVSPISKGLQARNRRPMRMCYSMAVPPKTLSTTYPSHQNENNEPK